MKPALPVRQMYEEHGWAVAKDFPNYKLLLHKYLEEGINAMDLPVGWFLPPPYYLKDKKAKPSENFAVVQKVIDYAHLLGIKVYIVEDAYLNPLYTTKAENIDNIAPDKITDFHCQMESGYKEPLLMCLENPVSKDLLRKNREIVYKSVKNIDGLVVYFGDPGGCYHKECLPHGEKIVQYMNEIYTPMIKELQPDLKIILTLWGIDYEDSEYVVNHINDLPKNVIAMQIPPTSMVAGTYLTFEPRRGELIKKAAKSIPVIIQQFYEGVGFRNGWVDIWEHPMMNEMKENFDGSYEPNSGIIGVYGSPFSINDQLVDLRVGMEWGWTPGKDSAAIIKELGDEQFGTGVGESFASAMMLMNDFWSKEVKRFHFFSEKLTDDEFAEAKRSMEKAQVIQSLLLGAEKKVKRNKLYYKTFTDLAELQVSTAKVNVEVEEALRFAVAGDNAGAVKSANSALMNSERAVEAVKSSERYSYLINHAWWQWWSISKRPDIIRNMINNFTAPAK
ncbi:MAG: hypothetical protein ACYC27_20860 [Armatimonadota bacterium]